ncbi:cupin domain-containing protein [Actinoplanes sp. G11-F43]|uniref:cupin domain-containing protein n=1 Tax=Actinoplanes sp. G11-F43 TaxID=3424130 RepID=UPI003D328B42
MTVFRESQAVAHRLDGVVFHAFASPSTGSRELCAWRVEIASGVTGSAHRVGRDEVLMVLAGELSFSLDGVAGRVAAGDVLVVPAGSEFRAGNDGPVTASAWVTTSAGFAATMPDGTSLTPPWAS